MAKSISRSLMLVAGIVAISGCQSLGDLQFAKRSQADQPSEKENRTRFTRQGMDLLRAGNNGQAIEAYNYALATGEEPAPAYNGLGVAYARLGRSDLAYRFFKKATMGAPDNVTYARNLARLMDSPEFVVEMGRRRALHRMPEKPGQAERTDRQAVMVQSVVRQPGSLVRADNRQVSLVTAPAAEVARTGDPKTGSRSCRAGLGKCDKQVVPLVESRQREREELALNQQGQSERVVPSSSPADDAAINEREGKRKIIIMPSAANKTTRIERRSQIAS